MTWDLLSLRPSSLSLSIRLEIIKWKSRWLAVRVRFWVLNNWIYGQVWIDQNILWTTIKNGKTILWIVNLQEFLIKQS